MKKITMKKTIRITSQWLLIGLLSTSPILPGISTVVEASTDQNITAQDNSFSQQKSTSMGFDYDKTTGTLSISSGVLDNPVPLCKNSALESVVLPNEIKKIIFTNKVTATGSLEGFFSNLNSLTSIEGLDNLDTSHVTSMYDMFINASSLISLDVSSFNTSNVKNMGTMFAGTSSLISLDVSGLDTSNVTSMYDMFGGTSSLISLDVSNFDTSNVTDMESMFQNTGIRSLDLSNFDTSNVTNMLTMFMNSEISDLNLSSFDTSKVISDTGMFMNTKNLMHITLGKNFGSSVLKKSYLPDHPVTENYTNKWQNVGAGTIESPEGKNVWTSDEFMSEFSPDRDADTYVWQPQPKAAADITVRYENSDGEEIHDSKILSGNVGNSYDATTEDYKLKIDGYYLDESNLPSNATGTFTDQAQTITYVYSKAPVAGGDVTVKYVDTEGNTISDDVVKTGNIGDDYSTEQKDFDGYTFKEVKDNNAVGQFTNQVQTVVYVYSKDTAVAEDLSHIIVHDSTLKVGDTWSPEENFDEATDFKGNIENFSDIVVDGTVDTKKPGTYEVTYRIPEEHLAKSNLVEGHHSATAKIVVANKDTETGGSGSESNNSGNGAGSSDKERSISNNLSVNNELNKHNGTNQVNKGLPQTGEHSSALPFITGLSLLTLGALFTVLRLKRK